MPPFNSHSSSRLESLAFFFLLITVVLTPLAFWPSRYFPLEAVKTAVISLGTLVSVVLIVVAAMKEKGLRLPPRSIVWIGALLVLSIVVSAFFSGQFVKSFLGQGFEEGAGAFVSVLFASGLVSYCAVARRAERAVLLYAGAIGSFCLLFLFQVLRLAFGPGFAPLGILDFVTSTVAGNWYSFGILSLLALIIVLVAVVTLSLSGRLKAVYWLIALVAAVCAFFVNGFQAWAVAAVIFAGLSIYLSISKPKPSGRPIPSLLKRLVWVPVIACLVSVVLAWKGGILVASYQKALNAGYSEIHLSWRGTLDVVSGELKDHPLQGSGPNLFTRVFLNHKPADINQTDAWSVEFNSGFGLIPTFFVTQGLVGGVLWIVFLVFFGILGVRSLRRPAADSEGIVLDGPARFIIVSSYAGAAFLWLLSIIYVPSHAVIYYAFVLTGVWLGSSVAYGCLRPLDLRSAPGSRAHGLMLTLLIALIVSGLWIAVSIKDAASLAYFGQGIRELNSGGSPASADAYFQKALVLNPMDVYWQARAEASLAEADRIIKTVTASSPASTTRAGAAAAGVAVNQALAHSVKAVAFDPGNYYNYLSEARVAELAASVGMADAYKTGLSAYTSAINLNPGNPSLYINLARFQAMNNQLDAALETVGAALQVKNNYLDAVFLLSQIEAAKGNLPDAVTAATFATQLNPSSPLLFLQLGLLEYANGAYADAAKAFSRALALQPDYANASYFLGLSDARLGKKAEAIAIFSDLEKTNPGNQNVISALSSLRSGKPPLSGSRQPSPAKPPIPAK